MQSRRPAVLLLHGLFGNPRNWQACAQALMPRWRVLTPELPLFGIPRHGDALGFLVDHLSSLLTREREERVVIAGNSLGGHLALKLALLEPERVAGLVLAGSSGLFERGLSSDVQRRPERIWLRRKLQEVFHDESHVTDDLIDEVTAIAEDRQKSRAVVRLARSAKQDSVREFLPKVFCPTLLIWGANDQVTPPATALEFKEHLPCAELHFLPDCGHAPMMEHPEEFSRLTAAFLQKLEGQPASDRQGRSPLAGVLQVH